MAILTFITYFLLSTIVTGVVCAQLHHETFLLNSLREFFDVMKMRDGNNDLDQPSYSPRSYDGRNVKGQSQFDQNSFDSYKNRTGSWKSFFPGKFENNISTEFPQENQNRNSTFLKSGKGSKKCGVDGIKGKILNKVWAGKMESFSRYPYVVALAARVGLHYSDRLLSLRILCTATIISDKWLITASHCLHYKGVRPMLLVMARIDGKMQKIGEIDHAIQHPARVEHWNSLGWMTYEEGPDLALLRLKDTLYRAHADSKWAYGKACLPMKNLEEGQRLLVMGYGWDPQYRDDKHVVDSMMKTAIAFKLKNCHESFYHAYYKMDKFDPAIFCTEGERGIHDYRITCQGDSGGPIFAVNNDSGRMILVGVLSKGSSCGEYNGQVDYADAYLVGEMTVEELDKFKKSNSGKEIREFHSVYMSIYQHLYWIKEHVPDFEFE